MLAAVITAVAVLLDQISKSIVVNGLPLYGEARFIPGVLSFYHTRNTGAAFSMLSDRRWVFMLLSCVAIVAITVMLYFWRSRHVLLTVSLSMILGGGIGNMIDRIVNGYVTDFFRVDFVDFAVFNVADSFLTVGAVLLGVYIIFFEPKVERRLAESKPQKGGESGGNGDE